MNIKTNLLEEYVNFVDNTNKKKQILQNIYNFNCHNYVFVSFFVLLYNIKYINE